MFVNIFMPKKPKINRTENNHEEVFKTQGQRVVNDGNEIVMENGRRFKRTVIPSKYSAVKPQDVIEDIEEIDIKVIAEADVEL
jgi:hypothetical protein